MSTGVILYLSDEYVHLASIMLPSMYSVMRKDQLWLSEFVLAKAFLRLEVLL